MFMRISSAAIILMLSSCGAAPVVENKVSQAKPDDRIECALGGTQDFTRACAIERGEETMLTLRHSDGGFRRLTLEPDGTIDSADGADALTVRKLGDGRTEVTVGEERYRLPATL
jgi:hypothetical protein